MFGISIEHFKIMVTKPYGGKGNKIKVLKANQLINTCPHISKIFLEKFSLKGYAAFHPPPTIQISTSKTEEP